MFNNKMVLANKDLFVSIFNTVGKNYNDFRQVVNNFDPPSLRPLAAWCLANNFPLPVIESVMSDINAYLKKSPQTLSDISVKKDRVVIHNQEFLSNPDDESLLLRFTEFIHSKFPIERQVINSNPSNIDMTPVLTGDGIKIYEVYNVNDARQAGNGTSWCIAYKGGENLWQNYRTADEATFFIVHDDNPPTPDQAKVAIDFNKREVSLTDLPNYTGQLLSNGMDWYKYSQYLESKNVNLNAKRINPEKNNEELILKNKPLSKKEKKLVSVKDLFQSSRNYYGLKPLSLEEINNFRKGKVVLNLPSHVQFLEYKLSLGTNLDLDHYHITGTNNSGSKAYFQLEVEKGTPVNFEKTESPDGNIVDSVSFEDEDAKTYTYQMIGLGHPLTDDAFLNLFDVPGGDQTLVQYINTGFVIPRFQENTLEKYPKYYKSYLRKLLQGGNYEHVLNYLKYDESELVYALSEENDKERLESAAQLLSQKDFTITDRYPQILLYAKPDHERYIFPENDELSRKVAYVSGLDPQHSESKNPEYALLYLLDKTALDKLTNDLKANKYNLLVISDFINKDIQSLTESRADRQLKSVYTYRSQPLPDYYPESEFVDALYYIKFKQEINNQILEISMLDEDYESTEEDYAKAVKGEVYASIFFNQEIFVNTNNFGLGYQNKTLFKFTDFESENEYTEYPLIDGALIYLDKVLTIFGQSKHDLLTGFLQSLGNFSDQTTDLLFSKYSKKEVFDKFSTLSIDAVRSHVRQFAKYFTCFEDFKALAALHKIQKAQVFDSYLYNITQEEINEHINDEDFIDFIIFTKPEILSDEMIDEYIIKNGLGNARKIIKNEKIKERAYQLWKERKLSPQDLGWNSSYIIKLTEEKNEGLISAEDVSKIIKDVTEHDAFINNDSLSPEQKKDFLEEFRANKIKNTPTELRTTEQSTEPTPEIPIEEKTEEDTTIAHAILMVKIARKLDQKKKYKLADSFTRILRTYHVQS